MPRRKIKVKAVKANCGDRQQARQIYGRLNSNKVSRGVQKRYDFAVWYFGWFCFTLYGGMYDTTEGIERQLLQFIEAGWEHGEPQNLMYDCLSGLQSIYNVRKCFPNAWKLMTVWTRLEPAKRAPPMPMSVLLVLAGLAGAIGLPDLALTLLLGFFGLLRTTEALSIRACHVTFSNDGQKAVISLPLTKSGQRRGWTENVIFEDVGILLLLREICNCRAPHERLLHLSPFRFRKIWKWMLDYLQVSNLALTPYSLRRGGATQMWIDTSDLTKVMMVGRWEHMKTCRIYVVDGQEQLTSVLLTDPARQRCEYYKDLLKESFR